MTKNRSQGCETYMLSVRKIACGILLGWVFLVSFSGVLRAESTRAVFDELKDSGIDFSSYGKICEEVTRLEIQKEAGPEYQVETGIEYGTHHRVYGELDVVKFKRTKGRLVLVDVFEVKCRKNLKSAYEKVEMQREHFFDALKEGFRALKGGMELIHFMSSQWPWELDITEIVPSRRDADQIKYIAVSQAGGKSAGFNRTLPYTLEQLVQLRLDIMQCQNDGICRAPGY